VAFGYRCEDFISLCEVHRRFLFSGPDHPADKKCCGTLFNPVPFFSHAGTCFSTYATVYERSPFTFSSIKVASQRQFSFLCVADDQWPVL
jgi:hypothetical protein